VSLERPVALSPKPEATRADGKPHGISFYEIRFKTFPADDPQGNPGFSDVRSFTSGGTSGRALPRQRRPRLAVTAIGSTRPSARRSGTKLGLDNLKEGIVTRRADRYDAPHGRAGARAPTRKTSRRGRSRQA
jgi:hypothetical protein